MAGRGIRTGSWLCGLLLTAVAASGAAAQTGGVRGMVRDGEGEPLSHAQVTVLPGGRQAQTDGSGRFEVRRLAPGTYRVEASLIGYAPSLREVRVTSGGVAEVELRLTPSPLALSGIQVTASPTGQPSAVAQATSSLSGKALDRELGGTIAQTLRYQPGVAVRFNGPGAALPVLRGLTGDRVLVLQDGERAADLSGSADDHGLTIDPLSAQRVEVVRGPATLLYGNNALGGVVNVISGDVSGGVALQPQMTVVAQTETAYPGLAVSARGAAPLGDRWSVVGRGGGRRASDMRIAADPVLGRRLRNTDMRSWNGSLALSHAGDAWSGSLALRGFDFAYGLPVPPGAEPVDLRGSRVELAGRSEVGLPSRLLPTVRAAATLQNYAHDELGDDAVVQQRFALRARTANVLVQQASLGPFREGAWGASIMLKHYRATGPAALTPPADAHAYGVFGFQELGLGSGGAALQFGARADRYLMASQTSEKFGDAVKRVFDAVSGSAGVRVPVSAALSLGATVARSFRAPTVEELFSAAPHAGTGAVEYGDPQLREERGRSVELVLHLRTARVNGQFAAYRNRVDDYIQLDFQGDTVIGGTPLPVYVYAQAPATLTGVEGAIEVAVHEHVAVGLRGDWLRGTQSDGVPLSFMPPARAGLTVRWDNGRYSVGGDAHREAAQRRIGRADETPTHAHTILRLDAAARFRLAQRDQSVSLRVDNIADTPHREATSRIRDFAPAPGRNIALIYRAWF